MRDAAGVGQCGMDRAVLGQECDAVLDFGGHELMPADADVHVYCMKHLRMWRLLNGRHITAVMMDVLALALVHAM